MSQCGPECTCKDNAIKKVIGDAFSESYADAAKNPAIVMVDTEPTQAALLSALIHEGLATRRDAGVVMVEPIGDRFGDVDGPPLPCPQACGRPWPACGCPTAEQKQAVLDRYEGKRKRKGPRGEGIAAMMVRLAKVAPIVLAAFLAGCAHGRIESFDVGKLRSYSYTQVCHDYGIMRVSQLSPAAKEQVEAIMLEKGMTATELEWVKRGKIAPGMSVDAMYAALGIPTYQTRAVVPDGVMVTYIYEYGYHGLYAYTRDGRIVASLED